MDEKTVADLFKNGIACSQIVFSELSDDVGINKDDARKIASLFGGGIWSGEVCGAFTGALMALGLKYGHCKEGDVDAQNIGMSKLMEFKSKFEKEYGSVVCRKIMDYDLSVPEEMKMIEEKGLFENFCPKLVCRTIQIAEDMLSEDKP